MIPDIYKPRFDLDEAQAASDEWNFNCGPSALAVMAGLAIIGYGLASFFKTIQQDSRGGYTPVDQGQGELPDPPPGGTGESEGGRDD